MYVTYSGEFWKQLKQLAGSRKKRNVITDTTIEAHGNELYAETAKMF